MARINPMLRTLLQPVAIALALAFVARALFQLYAIPSESMAPTLRAGDRIVVMRYLTGSPGRGNVVVFLSPADERELLVKRIVAVPGDLVDSSYGRLRVGNRTVAEPYARAAQSTGEIHPFIVPAGSYFVLGDHRSESVDSRNWGVVPESAILGRARLVLWSAGLSSSDVARASSGRPASLRTRAPGDTRFFKWID